MLREQVNIAGVELLGFVEVRLALVPVASPPFDIGQALKDPAVMRQKALCLLKVFRRQCRNLSGRRSDRNPWPIRPRQDWAVA